MSDAILASLRRLAGQNIFVGLSEVGAEDGLLDPEPDAVAKAIQKRRLEFAAGRRAARMAMASANCDPAPIPQGENRAPLWPEDLLGSISHDAGLAIAAVARQHDISRLGLDLAAATEFPAHLRREILLTAQETAQAGLEARVSFSAKESVFKAFYPEVGRYFGFSAVEIAPNIAAGTFVVTLRRPLGNLAAGATLTGRLAIIDNRLITVLSTPA